MAYPFGFGLCKVGALLIHAGWTEEEPTLCKNHPSTELRAGPSAELRAGKEAAPRMFFRVCHPPKKQVSCTS